MTNTAGADHDARDRPAAEPWRLTTDRIAAEIDVDVGSGLSDAEADRRRLLHGPNRLPEAARRPAWRRLVAQFSDLLILILIGAAVTSFVINREFKTPVVVLAVVVLNAIIGFVQEGKAERSLDALRTMMVTTALVRRAGRAREVPADELVPGDVVLVEAGDRIPADGRWMIARNLEITEAMLTGESQPVAKGTEPIDRSPLPLGDRSNLAFMNTAVTRGRGEFVVLAIGTDTEVGKIADLLADTETSDTPLQRQLRGLAHSLAKLAGAVVLAVVAIGIARGQPVGELFDTAVALAVASIPEGLPAVTAVTLALGVQRMAHQNAIVKRLAAVETLGCTSVICTDKTGTLTQNRMAVRELVVGTQSSPIDHADAVGDDVAEALTAMVLCNDASVVGDDVVGDPTEGALVTFARLAGLDVDATRASAPRTAEVPFESATKYMATVHRDPGETAALRLIAKGAPDVLLDRITSVRDADGTVAPIGARRTEVIAHNERMAARGLRVLAIAERSIGDDQIGDDVAGLVRELTLVALVGIVDPPRPEARAAIAEAHDAGISVRMITGDHAITASAIGAELGLTGRAVTGAQLDAMDDPTLLRELDEIAVFARVAPEHKLRLVTLFRERGDVVAMTGDGVNDAPALKRSDMGIAMGIAGTEVTKEAATMVLADDNFATIVRAVEQGRTIYGNIVNFVRFQLSTTLGFALLFLLASALGIAGGKPFTAVAILWVNLIMDGPPAMALGVDRPESDIMARRPRPIDERILTPRRWWTILQAAAVMAIGTLAVLEFAPGDTIAAGTASIGGTMAFTTFVMFQFFNILNARSDRRSVFDRRTLENRWLWAALTAVIGLQVAVVHVGPLQSLFDTTSLEVGQWLVCVLVASSVLWAEEARKLIARRRPRPS